MCDCSFNRKLWFCQDLSGGAGSRRLSQLSSESHTLCHLFESCCSLRVSAGTFNGPRKGSGGVSVWTASGLVRLLQGSLTGFFRFIGGSGMSRGSRETPETCTIKARKEFVTLKRIHVEKLEKCLLFFSIELTRPLSGSPFISGA